MPGMFTVRCRGSGLRCWVLESGILGLGFHPSNHSCEAVQLPQQRYALKGRGTRAIMRSPLVRLTARRLLPRALNKGILHISPLLLCTYHTKFLRSFSNPSVLCANKDRRSGVSSPVVTWQSKIPGSKGLWFSLEASVLVLATYTENHPLISQRLCRSTKSLERHSILARIPTSGVSSRRSHTTYGYKTELFAPSSRTPKTSSWSNMSTSSRTKGTVEGKGSGFTAMLAVRSLPVLGPRSCDPDSAARDSAANDSSPGGRPATSALKMLLPDSLSLLPGGRGR